ncbi:MAG: phosphoglycerate kinase, partial [Geminicoccaceae bacterium]
LADKLPAYAGRLMQAELEALEGGLGNPARPVAALVGGAKVSTKLDVLTNLTGRVDVLIIGGGMANTFLHAQGVDVGKSLCEKDLADTARAIMAEAQGKGCTIVLPSDGAIAKEFAENAPYEVLPVTEIPADGMMLDVGPASAAAAADALADCKTLVWNGPMGAFEILPFDAATNQVARAAAKLTGEGKLMSVAGGGDTVAALAHAGVLEQFSYVSTAGGAFLEWLEGKELPGVASLRTA